MGRRLSKKQRRSVKEKHKRKQFKKKESQDARGISRKRYKLIIKPKTFFILKSIGIVMIPLTYFLYSPLLVIVMAYFILLFFAAIGCEHSLNKSVIKSNHIRIPKYDSAIALLLVSIALFGSIFHVSSGPVGRFANTIGSKILQSLKNFGTLLTGERSILRRGIGFVFGTMDKPDGFIPNHDEFVERFGDMPAGGPPGGRPTFELSMEDIPIEFMFSQILSTAATVLIFTVMAFGIISLVYTMKKIKKFNTDQNTIILDHSITMLSEDELDSIIDFGVNENEIKD